MLDPTHTLHLLLMRLCSHICDPPHSLHVLLMRLWGQMLGPRHSLHWLSTTHIAQLDAFEPPVRFGSQRQGAARHGLRRMSLSLLDCDTLRV